MFYPTWNVDYFIQANQLTKEVNYNNQLRYSNAHTENIRDDELNTYISNLEQISFWYAHPFHLQCFDNKSLKDHFSYPYPLGSVLINSFSGIQNPIQLDEPFKYETRDLQFASDEHDYAHALAIISSNFPDELIKEEDSVKGRRDLVLFALSYVEYHLYQTLEMRWFQPYLDMYINRLDISKDDKTHVLTKLTAINKQLNSTLGWKAFHSELKQKALYLNDASVLPTAESIGTYGLRCLMLENSHYDLAQRKNVSQHEENDILKKHNLITQSYLRLPIPFIEAVFSHEDYHRYKDELQNESGYCVKYHKYTSEKLNSEIKKAHN
ncbi:MAG: hypothetical protein HAW67_06925 [Endozoicomonadaceae bacterium]|nr:hypothetical protein [Endozoicomonadaceae bacterium]